LVPPIGHDRSVAIHLAKFSHGDGGEYCGGLPNRRHIEAFITESQ